MNDKDKEAFKNWFEKYWQDSDDKDLFADVWQAACLYKQKEIDEIKNVTYWTVEQDGKVTRHISISEIEKLQAENTKLEIQLWQALGAMGYPVPGHIPEGDYKCGLCESKEVQMIRKDAHQEALLEVIRILSNNRSA